MPILLAIVMVPCFIVGVWALVYLLPITNKAFALIWEDPTERQQREILKRLQEHHVDGGVPEETAVLMTAAEMSTTEANLLQAAKLFSPADAAAVLTGKRNIVGVVAGKVAKHMTSGMSGRKPRKRSPRDGEAPPSDGESI